MPEWLARYSLRERIIVGVALAVVLVLGLHALIIEPYQLRLAELQDALEQQQADLEWTRSVVARLPRSGGGTSGAQISGSLANFINQAVRRQGLIEQMSQISPVGEDEIRMRYNAVEFNRLISFIAVVSNSGLEIKDIRISAVDNPGVVDSSIVLVRQ